MTDINENTRFDDLEQEIVELSELIDDPDLLDEGVNFLDALRGKARDVLAIVESLTETDFQIAYADTEIDPGD